MKDTKNNLVWFRNDVRVNDNAVLYEACKTQNKIIGVYCFNPKHFSIHKFGFRKTEKFRAKFLLESLTDLKSKLKALNIELLVYFDHPEIILPKVCETYQISNIYLQTEWTQEEIDTENSVKSQLTEVTWHHIYNQFLYHPEDLNFKLEDTPQIFTIFRKTIDKHLTIREVVHAEKRPNTNLVENTTTLPKLKDLGLNNFTTHPKTAFPFKGGETEALKRIQHYFFDTKKLGFYKKTRNGLSGKDYSSKLSAWLANGSISAKTIYWQVKQFEQQHYKNQSTYWLIFELIWRDYFKYISLKHGNNIFKLGGILNKAYDWSTNQTVIQQWINGETASDFINANMIELKNTGWMSNRGRQNVASYFAKHLKLDWRIGASYFESLLMDYDVHSNYGNWMYVAGVGNDPRDRVFNVNLQAERYDIHETYRKQWLQQTLC